VPRVKLKGGKNTGGEGYERKSIMSTEMKNQGGENISQETEGKFFTLEALLGDEK